MNSTQNSIFNSHNITSMEDILNLSKQNVIYTFFTLKTCVFCHDLEAIIETLLEQKLIKCDTIYKIQLDNISKLEIDKIRNKFLIHGVPTLLVIENGNIHRRIDGINKVQDDKTLHEEITNFFHPSVSSN